MKMQTRWLLILLLTGFYFSSATAEPEKPQQKILYWYDPMVPDKHFEQPGKSPFMDMDLVPKYAPATTKSEDDNSPRVEVSAQMQQTLGLRTAPVQHQSFANVIHASGKLMLDETRMVSATVRTDGYIEQLQVRAAGEHVVQGEKLASIYSPALQTAQAEYLLALNHALPGTSEGKQFSDAKARLLKLGMADQDIAVLSSTRQILPRVGLYAPINGFVMTLAVREGDSVTSGMAVMQLVDHQHLWAIITVPEREASDVHIGQTAALVFDSQPGKVFDGTVQYIYPELDSDTRSLRVRIALDNLAGKLMPGMYVQAKLLTTARTVLAVPTEAIIVTGTRSVVLVKEQNHFRPATVAMGAEQEGYTEILSGLAENETVVTSGQFLIDSEASLSGVLARMDNSQHAIDSAKNNSGATP